MDSIALRSEHYFGKCVSAIVFTRTGDHSYPGETKYYSDSNINYSNVKVSDIYTRPIISKFLFLEHGDSRKTFFSVSGGNSIFSCLPYSHNSNVLALSQEIDGTLVIHC